MNSTIDYYNVHADDYYWTTVGVDLSATRILFASYLPPEARVIDMGCGSGRDVMAFCNMGFDAVGLDASEELVRLATERLEIRAFRAHMSTWRAGEPFDGIWCCASLMHLSEEGCRRFFSNLEYNLKPGGALYISVKSGIETGTDESGRYMQDFSEEDIRVLAGNEQGLQISKLWYTDDTLSGRNFKWLNVIITKAPCVQR